MGRAQGFPDKNVFAEAHGEPGRPISTQSDLRRAVSEGQSQG